MVEMVVGFMIDEAEDCVVLIEKIKPDWMMGLLNGVGGKIEGDETPLDAMVREYEEETGVKTERFEWLPFLTMDGTADNFKIFYFIAKGDISTVKTVEAEEVIITKIDAIGIRSEYTIENLPWILSLGLDVLKDGRPKDAYVYY